MLNILSIQSSVAYGHVGNSAAVFPLQRLGIEVWPVITVHFSNHTGYGAWRGPVLGPDDIAEVLTGIEERGVLPSCNAVLSGYMGDAGLGRLIVDAAAKVKALNPQALYCCDPVMGDVGRGFFVRPGIPDFMRQTAVPAADIITPNAFELAWLTDTPIASVPDASRAAARAPSRSTRQKALRVPSNSSIRPSAARPSASERSPAAYFRLSASCWTSPARHRLIR